jgi:hypothetical protein
MISPVCLFFVCLSVCVSPLITFEPVGRFYEIQQEGHATEGDLDSISFNNIASTILKWVMFRLLRWIQNLHHSSLDFLGSGLVTIVMSQCVSLLGLIVEQHCIVGICTCAVLVWNHISARFSKYVRVIWYSIAEKII